MVLDHYASADNVTLPDDRTPLEEPSGPIDPTSAEAAGQVVQTYGALIEQRRFAEAEKLWRESPKTRLFTDDFRRNRETHLEIGELGEPHGAAGSIYVTIPITFYGRNAAGSKFRQPAVVSLRRVNDVPGSTEAQRRWHIDDLTFVRLG